MKKTVATLAFSLSILAHSETYVIHTNGGAALQPVVQSQLNQLPQGGRVMVYQDQLILNTTPANYRTISQFIRQIDHVPESVTVAVRVGENNSNYQNTGYGNIGIINRRVYVNGHWQNVQSQTTGNYVYQIQTLSGQSASIGLSQIMPVNTINTRYGYGYPQVWIGQTLLNANQGIAVTPTKLTNGQFQVQLSQANDKFSRVYHQPVVTGQSLSTTVTVNPNQWTTIGYISNQGQTSGNYGQISQSGQTPIQILVR